MLTPFLRWTGNEENQNISRLGFNWADSLIHVSLNSTYINSPQIELRLSKKFRNAYIQIERKILVEYKIDQDILPLINLSQILSAESYTVFHKF